MILQFSTAGGGYPNSSDPLRSVTEELLGRSYVRYSQTDVWQPSVNVYEAADRFLVCVDLAGMKPDHINVMAHQNKLVLRGERQPPVPADANAGDVKVHLMEIDSGAFRREIEFRQEVRQGEIAARYVDGLLWITVPKQ